MDFFVRTHEHQSMSQLMVAVEMSGHLSSLNGAQLKAYRHTGGRGSIKLPAYLPLPLASASAIHPLHGKEPIPYNLRAFGTYATTAT